MLQAITTDATPRLTQLRERESGVELQDPAFAGFLAFATGFTNLPGPTPSAPKVAAPPERAENRSAPMRVEERPERTPTPERESRATREGAEELRKEPDAPARDTAPPREAPRDTPEAAAAEDPSGRPTAPPDNPAKPLPQVQLPLSTPTTSAPIPTSTWVEDAQLQAAQASAAVAGLEGTGDTGTGKAIRTSFRDPLVATLGKALSPLESAAPGVQLRLQFSEGNPTGSPTAKPALTELLTLPKPEIELPKHLSSTPRTEAVRAPDTPPAPPAPKAVEAPAPSSTVTAASPAVRETVLAATAVKAEPLATKNAPGSGSPLSVAGGTPLIKGGTAVPSLEATQGTRANATFTQLDGSIRWLIKNQEKGAEIQLNPESLGRVVIKLRMEGGEVHARLWASEPTTLPILQDQKAALEASLRQQGLSLGSFDLQQGRRGDDASGSSTFTPALSGAGIAESFEKKQDLPIVPPALLGGAHLIELLA